MLSAYPDILKKVLPASTGCFLPSPDEKWVPAEPVIHINDSHFVKPDWHKFKSLGIIRDGSESTAVKNVYKKGEHVTETSL